MRQSKKESLCFSLVSLVGIGHRNRLFQKRTERLKGEHRKRKDIFHLQVIFSSHCNNYSAWWGYGQSRGHTESLPSAFWKYRRSSPVLCSLSELLFQHLLFILSQAPELPLNTYEENIINICWYWLRRDLSWIGFAIQSNHTPEHKVNST